MKFKKIVAAAAAMALCLAVLASCGEENSSSKADHITERCFSGGVLRREQNSRD